MASNGPQALRSEARRHGVPAPRRLSRQLPAPGCGLAPAPVSALRPGSKQSDRCSRASRYRLFENPEGRCCQSGPTATLLPDCLAAAREACAAPIEPSAAEHWTRHRVRPVQRCLDCCTRLTQPASGRATVVEFGAAAVLRSVHYASPSPSAEAGSIWTSTAVGRSLWRLLSVPD